MDSNKNTINLSSSDTHNSSSSPIREFYRNKNIFISGATGFVGKCILEKLLRTCNTANIYVLIRPKKGQTPQGRLSEVLNLPVFKDVMAKNPNITSKVKAIEGDLLQPDLGISKEDRLELAQQVNVVFHSAASVKFNDPIKRATDYNICGTSKMLDLVAEIRNLTVFVHVSTAYAFCEHRTSEERLYPVTYTPQKFMQLMESMTDAEADRLTPKFLEGRPNTYTLTKGLTEHLVVDRCTKHSIPFCIGRPSIVMSSDEEPVQGWIDSINGPTGVSVLCSLGLCRVGRVAPDKKVDLVPVDIVANGLIALGWYTGTGKGPDLKNLDIDSPEQPMYNMTTGELNPITWGEYFDIGRVCATRTPSARIVRPIAATPNYPSTLRLELTRFFSEFLFAWVIDQLVGLLGHKKFMVRMIRKMHEGFEHLDFFSARQWNFRPDNYLRVISAMSAEDRFMFQMDVRVINWNHWMQKSMLGVRRMILKEDDSTIPAARVRYHRLIWGYTIFKVLFFGLIYYHLIRPSWVGCLLSAFVSSILFAQSNCDIWTSCSL